MNKEWTEIINHAHHCDWLKTAVCNILEIYTKNHNPQANDNWRLFGGYRFSMHWDAILSIYNDPNIESDELNTALESVIFLYKISINQNYEKNSQII